MNFIVYYQTPILCLEDFQVRINLLLMGFIVIITVFVVCSITLDNIQPITYNFATAILYRSFFQLHSKSLSLFFYPRSWWYGM